MNPVKMAKADVRPIRQRTQYSCMAASMTMALGANGVETNEDEVNKVMGCKPMQGASWEQALACAQHFGMRATLVTPCSMSQLKAWTDRGVPVMIAWNPEGRDWSHASLVFDVDDEGSIHVADPNIPDPEQTVRIVSRDEFLKKWFEKWPDYLVRRPALAIEREITLDGRQIAASQRTARKIEEVWAVGSPGPSSELEDIWFNASGFVESQFRDYQPMEFFTDKAEARAEATERLKDRDKTGFRRR